MHKSVLDSSARFCQTGRFLNRYCPRYFPSYKVEFRLKYRLSYFSPKNERTSAIFAIHFVNNWRFF